MAASQLLITDVVIVALTVAATVMLPLLLIPPEKFEIWLT